MDDRELKGRLERIELSINKLFDQRTEMLNAISELKGEYQQLKALVLAWIDELRNNQQ